MGLLPDNYVSFSMKQLIIKSDFFKASYSTTFSSPFLHDYDSSISSLNQLHSHNLPPAPPVSSTSLSSAITNENTNFHLVGRNSSQGSLYSSNLNTTTSLQSKTVNNEPPPAYESLMIKSSSLPSYYHLTDKKVSEKKTHSRTK